MKGVQALAVYGAVDEPTGTPTSNQLASTKHAKMPAERRLAQFQGVGQLLDGDLLDAGQELQDLEARDAGQRLVMGAELPE
jgi:hypothetical protein